MFTMIWEWLMARWAERSTWNGTMLIAAGVVYLLFQPLAVYVAYAAIAYGAWTFLMPEN